MCPKTPMVGSFLITHMCHACECEIAAPSPGTSTRVDAALLFSVGRSAQVKWCNNVSE